MHDQLRATFLSRVFPCVGAKIAFESGAYFVGLYEELGSGDATVQLADDLGLYLDFHERGELRKDFSTFVACFVGPAISDENAFEQRLWCQLQQLHALDGHPWDPGYSSDPTDPYFSFSFHGKALFPVGLNPYGARWARRSPCPAIAFTLHDQTELLRRQGRYESLRDKIRERDLRLQGSTNPVVSDMGEASEARQYSGREVEADWHCPFVTSSANRSSAQSERP